MGMRLQKIKVKDYGDDLVNRLAVILTQFEQMTEVREREATLDFLNSKYRASFHLVPAGFDTSPGAINRVG